MNIINIISNSTNYDALKENLKTTSIQFKEDGDSDLAILFSPFTLQNSELSEEEKECRSIIINKNTLEIVAYTQPKILYNDYLVIADSEIRKEKRIITECFEGTTLTMFNYKDEWFLSTRKCVNAKNSVWKSTKSHLELAKECIDHKWDEFCKMHDKNKVYLYVLIHHENVHLIDYSDVFGSDYKKLMLIMTRDKADNLPTYRYDYDGNLYPWETFYISTTLCDLLVYPKFYSTYACLDEYNRIEENSDSITKIRHEGILVSTETDKHIKLHTNSYKVYNETTDNHYQPLTNIFYISLYQKNKLDVYLNTFSKEMYFTASDKNIYLVKGLIDCLFKVLTSEILILFKLLWDIKTGQQQDKYKDLYLSLTSEYKKIFYHLRGIYFSKRTITSVPNKYITVKTVYELLKSYDPLLLCQIVKDRKEMINYNSLFKTTLIENNRNEFIEKPLQFIRYAEEFIEKDVSVTVSN